MGLLYAAGFQVTSSSPGNMQAVVAGSTATIGAGYYLHGALDTVEFRPQPGVAYEGYPYSAFADAVKTAFDTATSDTFTVSWSLTTGLYTISRATNFTLAFSGAAQIRLRNALGFTGDKSGANSYISDVVPAFCVESEIAGRTNVLGPFEPDDIADEAVSDGGDAFVITRKTWEQIMSWQQSMEPRTNVYQWAANAANAGLDVPYSWQQWFYHTRGAHPFWCNDSLAGETSGVLYQLTAKGASFRPQRVTADFDDYWIVPFEARWLAAYVP